MDPENQMEISVEDPPPLERNFYDSPIREEESEDAPEDLQASSVTFTQGFELLLILCISL